MVVVSFRKPPPPGLEVRLKGLMSMNKWYTLNAITRSQFKQTFMGDSVIFTIIIITSIEGTSEQFQQCIVLIPMCWLGDVLLVCPLICHLYEYFHNNIYRRNTSSHGLGRFICILLSVNVTLSFLYFNHQLLYAVYVKRQCNGFEDSV